MAPRRGGVHDQGPVKHLVAVPVVGRDKQILQVERLARMCDSHVEHSTARPIWPRPPEGDRDPHKRLANVCRFYELSLCVVSACGRAVTR